MSFEFGIHYDRTRREFAALERRVELLRDRALRGGVRRAMMKASLTTLRLARSRAGGFSRSGALGKSLVRTARTDTRRNRVRVYVGPRRGFALDYRAPGAGSFRERRPSRYAHLVDKGTRRSRARPFLLSSGRDTAGRVLREFNRLAGGEIEKTARRLARRR